jgi:hypothetical protein
MFGVICYPNALTEVFGWMWLVRVDRNNEGRLAEEEQVRFNALLEGVQRIPLHSPKLLVDQKRPRKSRRRARGAG